MVCRNHPDTGARRYCYFCKIPICPACQKKKFHHIFCGEDCAKAFQEKETVSADLPTQLQKLDQSLNDDLREYGDIVVDSFKEEIQRFEENLDRALTSIATMIEGGASATASDVEKSRASSLKHFSDLQRKFEDRIQSLSDVQKEAKQLLLSLRSESVELKLGVSYLEKNFQERLDSLKDSQNQHTNSIESFQTHWKKEQREAHKKLEDTKDLIAKDLSKQLQRILDDIATLTVAQRGNWQDVVDAAKNGAEKATNEVRPEVQKRLTSEIEALARHQSKEISKTVSEIHTELKKRIRKGTENGWIKPLATGFVGIGFGALLTFMTVSKPERVIQVESTANLEDQLKTHDESLRSWVTEKLAALNPSRPSEPDNMVPIPAITRGNTGRKEIAFTFDAGSNADAATDILNALKSRNIHSTMFLTGAFIDQYPEVVRRIAAEGHEAGNHLLEHNHVVDPKTRRNAYTKEEFFRQISEVEKRYRNVTGKELAKVWRAPYGDINPEVIQWAATIGYRHVGWTRSGRRNLDSLDWVSDPKNRFYRTSDQIVNNILDFDKFDPHGLNGAVLLMHLGTTRSADQPHKRLTALLSELQKRGYAIVPVSVVLRTEVAVR